ncbi:MAG: hypothetical protein GY719_35735 [bacterium]|nr:hypothetical protein [bacterium]
MSRKTRRSKAGEDVSEAPAKAGASKKTTAAKTASAKKVASAQKTPASKKAAAVETAEHTTEGKAEKQVSLPAFGFAEDLLKKRAEPAEAPDEAPADPNRIFAFADSLDAAAEEQSQAEPVRLETWVAFSLAGEVFAIPVDPIREIVRVASITRVPHAPQPIRGVTNMRGRVIPVIDLRQRIELEPVDLARGSRVIVVRSRGRLLGLLVDGVHQVIHIDLAQAQPPPEDVMTAQSDYISGVYHLDDQLILLLDLDRALVIQEAVPAEVAAPASAVPADGAAPAGAV